MPRGEHFKKKKVQAEIIEDVSTLDQTTNEELLEECEEQEEHDIIDNVNSLDKKIQNLDREVESGFNNVVVAIVDLNTAIISSFDMLQYSIDKFLKNIQKNTYKTSTTDCQHSYKLLEQIKVRLPDPAEIEPILWKETLRFYCTNCLETKSVIKSERLNAQPSWF